MFLENIKALDAIDRRILQLLSENARISYVDIGEIVGLSRVAVKARIQALEEKGIIEQYTVIINPQKIANTFSAYFEITLDPTKYEEAIDYLKKSDCITQIYQVLGNTKFHIHAILNGENEVDTLLQNFIYKTPGLKDLYFNSIVSRIKDIKNIRL